MRPLDLLPERVEPSPLPLGLFTKDGYGPCPACGQMAGECSLTFPDDEPIAIGSRAVMGYSCACGSRWRKETTMVQRVVVRPA